MRLSFKKLILIFCFLCSAKSMVCQKDSIKFYLGIKLGFGVTFLDGLDVYKNAGYTKNDYGNFVIGLSSAYKFNRFFSVGADLIYNLRGGGFSKVNDSLSYVNIYYNGTPAPNNGPPRYYQHHKISSLDIPCYLKIGSYNRKFSPFLNLGLVPSFTLDYTFLYNDFSGGRNNDHITDLKENRMLSVLVTWREQVLKLREL